MGNQTHRRPGPGIDPLAKQKQPSQSGRIQAEVEARHRTWIVKQAKMRCGNREIGTLGGHDRIAAQRHLKGAADARALDSRDDRHRAIANRCGGALNGVVHGTVVDRALQIGEIGAGAEPVAGAGKNHRSDVARAGIVDRAGQRR